MSEISRERAVELVEEVFAFMDSDWRGVAAYDDHQAEFDRAREMAVAALQGLDVERLARALEAAMSGKHVTPIAIRAEFGLPPIWEPLAADIARAYADLPAE